ncbi:MAG: hypothetical protein RLO52_23595 [Sandaracinaceae bacterium]
MRIEADSVLRHSRDAVFAAYRDDLPAFVEFLPNVRSIEVIERQGQGDIVHLHNVWHGATELPTSLASALEARVLSWDDHAAWDEAGYTCDWVIEPHAFRNAVRCRGQTTFIDLDEGRTRIEMNGELSIDLERVRAIPTFLAGSLARTAEAFLLRQLTANLASVSDALANYLREDTLA